MSWPSPFDREEPRRRALAFAGLWFLLAGMLAALGFAIVLLASLAFVLVGAALVAGLWLVSRYRMGRALPVARVSIERASRKLGESLDELNAGERLQRLANGASHRARSALEVRPRKPAVEDPHRRARRLNALGAQLRRDGDYAQAAEQHRQALAILRELDDRRAEALTLNNLALALVHTGGVSVAVEHFEQALVLLRELEDREHEGQVIANLGFVRHRQGRDDDAESLFNAALDRLPPESSAYRRVEEQLRRAS